MKKLFLIAGLTVSAFAAMAQHLPLYSQYMLNDFPQNPGIAGKDPYWQGISDSRYQWIGITDAPRTYCLSVHGPHRNMKMGFGGYLFHDIVGPTRRFGASLVYSYHVKFSDNFKMNLGLSAGVLQFAVDGAKITLHDPIDLVISNGYQSVMVPDFGFGVYCHGKDWYFGVSAPQIYPARLNFFSYSTPSKSNLVTHFYGMGGYKFHFGDFALQPCVLTKYVYPAPFQFDAGVRLLYKEKVWIGGAYRNLDAIPVMVGYLYKDFLTIGYSYDITTTNIRNYSTGTHEIVIGMRFNPVEEHSAARVQ